jgi:hypothetical protein
MDLFEPKPKGGVVKKERKPTLNLAAVHAARAAEKSPNHPSLFRVKRSIKAGNKNIRSAANFRKWKFNEGFAPEKKPTKNTRRMRRSRRRM